MIINYIVPGPLDKTELGRKELDRRQKILNNWAFEGTKVIISAPEEGPDSIESVYDEYLSIPGVTALVNKAKEENYDALIIGCFGDPGLEGYREITCIPVVGPARASLSLAATLGHHISIITITKNLIEPLRELSWKTGISRKLKSVRAVDMHVIDYNKDQDKGFEKIMQQAEEAVQKDGADVIVLGCMSMGFANAAKNMMHRLHVPVVNPAMASLKHAETLISLGLTHSPQAYPFPPKMEQEY